MLAIVVPHQLKVIIRTVYFPTEEHYITEEHINKYDNIVQHLPCQLQTYQLTLTYLQILKKVLKNRLSSSLDEHQSPEHAAYRRGFSTIDHLHAVTEVLEKTTEYNVPLYMAFVDYTKAFDSIQHRAVFEALKVQGVQEKYMNIIKETYAEGTPQIRTDKLSGKIKIMRGVRHGDTVSPVMFTVAVEVIFKMMNIEAGISINGVRLSNLRFADDIILFAESEEKLGRYAGRSEQRR